MHDMSLTEKYVVIYDQPVTVNFDMLATPQPPIPVESRLWKPVGLMPRKVPLTISFGSMCPWYCFHPMNAYDNVDGSVTIDLCNYPRMFDRIYWPFGDSLSRLERWTLNPATRRINIQVIVTRPQTSFQGIDTMLAVSHIKLRLLRVTQ